MNRNNLNSTHCGCDPPFFGHVTDLLSLFHRADLEEKDGQAAGASQVLEILNY